MRRRTLLVAGGALLAVVAGCGGSGNPPEVPAPQTVAPKLDIAWSARSKAVNAPSSALSAVVKLARGRASDNAAITFPAIDRSDAPGAYTQNYVAPTAVRTGQNLITVTFHAGKGGTGAVVGTATRSFLLSSDGTGAGDILLVGKVQKVIVLGDNAVAVGGSQALNFSARDGNGSSVAVSPGSARFVAQTGAAALGVTEDGNVTGLSVGTAGVTATVDGVTSGSFTVNVTPPAGAKAVVAAGQSVLVGQSKPLLFSVTDADGNAITVDPSQRTFLFDSGAGNVTIAADGTLTGVKVGAATVRLKVGDTLTSDPATITVQPASDAILVTIAPQQSVAVNETKKLTFTATDDNGTPLPLGEGAVQFNLVSGGAALTLAADGTVTGKAAGVAVVTATVSGVTSKPQSVFVGDVVTTPSGLKYIDIAPGNGGLADPGTLVSLHYVGTLLDGTKFDSSRDRGQPFSFRVGTGAVIKGFDEGVGTMHVGGTRILIIPPALGYKDRQQGSIPPNSTLIFDLELLRVDP